MWRKAKEAFASAGHAHGWGAINDRPESFPPSAHSHALATESQEGFMSPADKTIVESLSGGAVTGAKGASESEYRTGNVNLTAADVGAFSGSVEVVEDMSLANLLSLPAGAYLVSSDAVGSPCPGSYGNMILSHAMPDGWTGRVNAIVAFDNGAVRVAVRGDWENGFAWCAVDNLGGLPLAGGTLSSPYAQISREGRSMSWYNGRDGAILRQTSYTGYNPALSMKSPAGSWEIGPYTSDWLYFNLISDSSYSSGSNVPAHQYVFTNDGRMLINSRSVFRGKVLYSNGTGTTGTVTLNENSGNFGYVRIVYRDNDWIYHSADVLYPASGKTVTLSNTNKATYAGNFWIKNRCVTISGTTITTAGARYGCIQLNGPGNSITTLDNQTNNIWIVTVIGYDV